MNTPDDHMLRLPVKLEQNVECPFRASPYAAGLDIRAAEDLILPPGASCLLSSGLSFAIPAGYEVQIRPRSGLSWKSRLRLANSPGTIDADYRDEIRIILWNAFSQSEIPALIAEDSPLLERFGAIAEMVSLEEYLKARGKNFDYPESLLQTPLYLDSRGELYGTETIQKGERVAQMILCPYPEFEFMELDDISHIGHDRGGGFGHTGRFEKSDS